MYNQHLTLINNLVYDFEIINNIQVYEEFFSTMPIRAYYELMRDQPPIIEQYAPLLGKHELMIYICIKLIRRLIFFYIRHSTPEAIAFYGDLIFVLFLFYTVFKR